MLSTFSLWRILVKKEIIAQANTPSPYFYLLLSIWFIVNVVQSVYTGLGYDEAYYWMFAKHLDWGYFDHPPMVALFIKLSGFLFSQELGVRFISIVAQLLSLCLLWKLLDEKEPTKKKIILFFGISASFTMFQVYGFITTPDSPLLFFTALFLYSYKKFLGTQKWTNILLLSLSMAGLVYSKYHGGLLIILTIMANIKILQNFRFWIAGSFALLLLTPHIWWQFSHDFISFQYQLVNRLDPFSIKHFINYWPNQLVSFNPFTFGAVLFIILKQYPNDVFQRTLHVLIYGFLIFFWIMSFWGHVEPQWTIACALPMIILVYNHSLNQQQIRKYVYHFVFPSLIFLGIARFALVFDILPVKLEFHNQKSWAMNIEKSTLHLPVVFMNSYQKASAFTFYTGITAFTLNNIYFRKNQFDLWDFEEEFHGKRVAFVITHHDPLAHELPDRDVNKTIIQIIDSLVSVQKIRIRFSLPSENKFKMNQRITLSAEIYNPYPYPISFNDPINPVNFSAVFIGWRMKLNSPAIANPDITTLLPGQTLHTTISFLVPDIPVAKYQFGISLTAGIFPEAFNSKFHKIQIIQ